MGVSTVAVVVVIIVIIIIAAIAGVILLSSSTTTQPPTTTTSSINTTSPTTTTSTTPTTSSSSSLTPVTFGLSVAITIEYLPEYVAAHGGFWKQLGLDVTLQPFQGDGAHMQAVSSGQVQIGEASYVGELNAISKNIPIKAVAMGLQQADMILIVSNTSKYTDPSQLKGATIGVTTAGSATDMMFHLLAAHYNFTIGTDIKELTAGGLQGQLAALTTNKTQGFFWTYETGYQLQTSGDAKILLFMNKIIPNWAENTIYATNSLISSNPTLVKNVLQGIYNALAYMEANKTYAVQQAEQYMSLSPQAANLTMTEAFASGQFSTDGNFTSQIIGGMNLARNLMLQLKISSSLVPVNQSFVMQFVPVTAQSVSPSPSAILPHLFIAASADTKV